MQKTLMTREQQLYQEATAVPKKKVMTARTKSNLSFVKQNRPELFKTQGEASQDPPVPAGFKLIEDGWLHNPDTGVFIEPAGQKLWFDPEAGEYQELFEGSVLPLCAHGGASSSSSNPAKHLFIPDLHRTAQVLKADLGHLDRPAALLALLDPSAVAQAPHERLIRRLAATRSEWSEEAISSALAAVLASCEVSGIALALVVGQRAFAAAKGASCWCFAELEDPAAAKQSSKVLCHDFEKSGVAYLVLAMGELGLKDAEIREVVLPHLLQGRPRAASVSLRRSSGAVGCMRLAANSASLVPGQPPTKRQRVVGVDAREVPGRVRIRQILLRFWKSSGPKPEDPVRRKQIQRTQEEAEGQLLKVLDELRESKDGVSLAKNFTLACRSSSECQSSLQGGELAGDLGWLDKDKGIDSQRANGKMVRPAVPAQVLRVAFDLEVGEMSDLVSSEVGVHLLLRSA